MKKSVFVTGADRGLGFTLCAGLLTRGWQVFAGQYMPDWPELEGLAKAYRKRLYIIPLDVCSEHSAAEAARRVAQQTDRLDMLINNAGVNTRSKQTSIRKPQNYADIHRVYDINAVGPIRVVAAFLPLLERGEFKRICFVSSEAGSITMAQRKSWFGYCMSKAALNMAVKILFNDLRPSEYTFRVYHPGYLKSYISGEKNLEATLELDEAAEMAIPIFLSRRADEDRLVMQDYEGQEWPW
jgi:NAD(P)-dependent dehydrogenase (short-subunit alcohol dehydrogenase family)